MKKLKLMSTILVSAITCGKASAGWYEVGNVTRVHSGHLSGPIYFTTETQVSVNDCNNVGYTIDSTAPNSERIYSLLLTAYVSKIPISIHATEACPQGRPEVDAVQFKDNGVQF